jgi:hypothetical protein
MVRSCFIMRKLEPRRGSTALTLSKFRGGSNVAGEVLGGVVHRDWAPAQLTLEGRQGYSRHFCHAPRGYATRN